MEEYSFMGLENISNNFLNDDLLDENSYLNENLDSVLLSDIFREFNNERTLTIINNYPDKTKIFDVKKIHSPGRKRKLECLKKKRHSSNAKDNILSKIHIHFLNFLVNFANDAIKTTITVNEKKKFEFKYIDHRIKKQISRIHLKNFITKQIKDILQLRISNKYRKFSKDKDYNQNIYNEVIAKSYWLKKLFDMNYLDAFKLYYNNCKPLASFEFEGKVVNFSEETESFICLYNEAETKEKKLRLKFIAEGYNLQLGYQTIFENELSTEL